MAVPRHVAIIMDGNGRWAKKRALPREAGHTMGAKNVEKIAEAADNLGIEYITYYAFSTENWERPQKEVDKLMALLSDYMKTSIKKTTKNNIRVRVIGDISRLSQKLQKDILNLEDASSKNTGLKMQLAINYGGRDEIVRAVNKAYDEMDSEGKPFRITQETISSYLDTKDIPDPDLLIRTGGEMRLSNFLMWQLSYAELYFTDRMWPEFSKEDLKEAIDVYEKRDRRYGGLKE